MEKDPQNTLSSSQLEFNTLGLYLQYALCMNIEMIISFKNVSKP